MHQAALLRTCHDLVVVIGLCHVADALPKVQVRSPSQSGGAQQLAVIPPAANSSVAASTQVAISGRNLLFLADEVTTGPGGTDLNLDADVIDSVAVVVDMSANVQTNLAVAAVTGAWIGNELYLAVDEVIDGKNWEPVDTGNTLVLLHWSAATPVLAFVDRVALAGATKLVAEGTNLFYSSGRIPTSPMDSNLEVISAPNPLVHVPVPTQDVGGPLAPRILGHDEGLIFLALDESAAGRDLNNDGDVIDTAVLALLDGTTATGIVRSTQLALTGNSSPFRARRTSAVVHDWQVGFLVSEAAQGVTNLNDPGLFAGSWQPPQCAGNADADAADDVLHSLDFAAWDGNPALNPPLNTGLAGAQKIVIVDNTSGKFIGVISREADEGTCDLNADGDRIDDVFRWVRMTTPVLPLNTAAHLHALSDIPGGTHGVAELDNRFVILVSESADDRDINGDSLKTLALIGWLSPSGAVEAWDFTPGAGSSNWAGATWMAEQPDRGRLKVAFPENVGGVNLNAGFPPVPGGDTDVLDSLPTFPDFSTPTTLSIPGVAIAVDRDEAGIVIAKGHGFYRVSEAEDSRDWNGDGDKLDTGLWRTSLTTSTSQWLSDLNTIPARLSVEVNPQEASPEHAAFIADETMRGLDFNSDGDALDWVVMWIVLGEDCNGNGTPDDVDIASATSADVNASGIPDECETTGTFYCFGDGSGAACPCGPGQTGGPGAGCRNSAGTGGTLSATGVASVASDTLTLLASGLLPNTLGLYLQGTSDQSGGQGSIAGDGLMCVGGAIVRLGVRAQTFGSSDFGFGSSPLVSVKGQVPAAGGTRYYQVYYRDSFAFCTPSTFNLTSALRIPWAP